MRTLRLKAISLGDKIQGWEVVDQADFWNTLDGSHDYDEALYKLMALKYLDMTSNPNATPNMLKKAHKAANEAYNEWQTNLTNG